MFPLAEFELAHFRWSAAAIAEETASEPTLSKQDVSRLLTQARQAIRDGNLERAEVLVTQAEASKVRYSLLHIGPTPSSLRRELDSAKKKSNAPTRPSLFARPLGAISPITNQNREEKTGGVDPFQKRDAQLPEPPLAEPIPPSDPAVYTPPQAWDPSISMDSKPLPALGHFVDNPFVAPPSESLAENPLRTANTDLPSEVPKRLPSQVSMADPEPAMSSLPPQAPLPPGSGVVPANFEAPATLREAPLPANQDSKAITLDLMRQARQALAHGQYDQADRMAQQASAMNIPESHFLPSEDRPSQLAWDLRIARRGQQAASPIEATSDDRNDANQPAQFLIEGRGNQSGPGTLGSEIRVADGPKTTNPSNSNSFVEELNPPAADMAADLLRDGEESLRRGDRRSALELFQQANDLRDALDIHAQQRLDSHLQMLSADTKGDSEATSRSSAFSDNLIDAADGKQQVLARQLSSEVGKRQSEAHNLRTENPQKALDILRETRQTIVDSQLAEEYQTQLLRRIDVTVSETEQYMKDHQAELDLEATNRAVLEEVERGREVKIKVQQKVAELVDEFNQLRDEQRYEEMEVVARRLYEMAPDEPIAQQVWTTAKFIRREMMNQQLADRREQDYWSTFHDVEEASQIPVGDQREMVFAKNWDQLVKNRRGSSDSTNQRTERELEIQKRLKTPVLLRYENTPLSQVSDELSQLTGVNIHLDPQGLSQEGWNSDTPITINLNKEISLKSALNLILEPLHLSYVIKDEVLKITSEQLRDGELEPKTYNVADLVIPIPNFVPNNNIGLQGLLNDAYAAVGYGAGGLGTPGPTVLVNNRGQRGAKGAGGDDLLAQQFSSPNMGTPNPTVPIGTGPGGLGGAEDADFDSLIDLIVSTVANESWAENGGGQAEIRPFPTNLSLVISQTQAVHDQIADLLQQLRKLQDLQVTIEVRFIRLSDNFFERIGIDFDVNIDSNAADNLPIPPNAPGQPSAIVGARSAAIGDLPVFTADLDVPFRQGGFDITVPAFGGGMRDSFATFGFAILSDIEAYFLIEAAQGDSRTNLLNAPKVTLFNGQQAFVADAVQRPFVISVIPVVGEFAAAQQPVIVVLSEGTLMTIQAVVSDDRRYVRMTVVPFFSQIGDVDTFTFEGSTSTSSSSSVVDDPDEAVVDEADSETRSGTTVQLPTFQFVSVVTTVSVPDGGTVLLGGIKRLNEGRSEFGVPLLSKLPYVNRLFRNVGIGRETSSLMMMVTPRIIIQEEEEEKVGINSF
jgi:general secretion pathway protein D